MPVVPITGQPLFNQSTTVQQVLDQCKLHTKLQNYFGVGNITGEPGLSIANRTNQMLLQRRMAWKFNRKELSSTAGNFMVTQQGVQDVRFAGASVFALLNNLAGGATLPTGGTSVDLNPITLATPGGTTTYGPINGGTAGVTISGTTITVQTIDPHPFQAGNIGQSILYLSGLVNPAFNSVFTWNQLTQTSAWTQGYQLIGIPDNLHLQLAATTGQYAPGVTGISQGAANPSGQMPTTVNVPNAFAVGDLIIPALVTNSNLNVETETVTAATPTTVTFLTLRTVTAGSESGSLSAAPTGAPGIFDLGWMESASIQDMNSTAFPQPVKPINAVHRIAPEYTTTGDKISICALVDYNNGVIKFRLSQPMGTYSFQLNVTYQSRAPKLTQTSSIFLWPDNLSYVLVDVALALAAKFAYGVATPEAQQLRQDAESSIALALASEDQEANEQNFAPELSIMR